MIAGATFLLLGTAVGYVMLLAGALAGAFSNAFGNPSTNKLIAEDLPAGERGLITGVKQSGVQFGIFLGGVTVPSIAVAIGWRGAYLVVAAIPLILALLALWVVPSTPQTSAGSRENRRGRLPAAIWWLAAYGFLSGFSGAVTFLVPLFAEETLGLSPIAGGIAIALVALVAVVGRIAWSRYAERSGAYRGSLFAMAGRKSSTQSLLAAGGRIFCVTQNVVENLRIYQTELQIQNDELRESQRHTEAALGRGLAAQHRVGADAFGWERDNWIGATPQENAQSTDWPTFFACHRLGFQVDLLETVGSAGTLIGIALGCAGTTRAPEPVDTPLEPVPGSVAGGVAPPWMDHSPPWRRRRRCRSPGPVPSAPTSASTSSPWTSSRSMPT